MSRQTADRWEDRMQDTLNQIGNAMRRGTGTYLTAEQVADLRVSSFGETCLEADPHAARGQS